MWTGPVQQLTEDGVDGVHRHLILGGVADEALAVSETDVGRRRPIPLVIGYDLDAIVLPHADAGVGRPEVDPDSRTLAFTGHCFCYSLGNGV